jgi:hypothetical protein
MRKTESGGASLSEMIDGRPQKYFGSIYHQFIRMALISEAIENSLELTF